MAEQWPTELQDYLNEENFQLTEGETNVETAMDVGPKKRRRRITNGVDQMTCSILVKKAEYNIFKNFYRVTLGGGIKEFEFNNPITETLETWRFTATPRYSSVGGGNFRINMSWEQLP